MGYMGRKGRFPISKLFAAHGPVGIGHDGTVSGLLADSVAELIET